MKNTPLKNDYISVALPTGMRAEAEAYAHSLGMKLGPLIRDVLTYAMKKGWVPHTTVTVRRKANKPTTPDTAK